MYRRYLKRSLDLLIAVPLFLAVLPLLLVTTALLFLSGCRSPFFLQERPGKGGRPFRLFKFKTMTDARDADGVLLPDEQRLTVLGMLIRKSSLDELPQLLNVIRGEMSLVGPRPLLKDYLPLYSDTQMRRHEVLPGITGLAQVRARNATTWERKFRYDVFYVDHLSFGLDMAILWWTVKRVITASDIAIEPRFEGSESAVHQRRRTAAQRLSDSVQNVAAEQIVKQVS